MKQRVKDIVAQGDRLFSKRQPIMDLWQSIALNFYPIRANFTSKHSLGDEFASHLMSSRPLIVHRELANAIPAMLRPRGQTWFHVRTDDEQINENITALQFLDAKTEQMRKIMYTPSSQFLRSTKQADNDYVAFGNAVLEVTPNRDKDGILYRSWHLKDVAWQENAEGVVDVVHRNWNIAARELSKWFSGKVAKEVTQIAREHPYQEIKCRHLIIPSADYDLSEDKNKRNLPFVSIYVDIEHDHIMEEVPLESLSYVIPRWAMASDSQYAHSLATIVSLPDARLLQEMTMTILEAGQKAVDPPLKATAEAVVGGVNIHAGGLTWVDAQYDEKNGKALETLMNPSLGLNWGDAQVEKIEIALQEGHFLNKISLPPSQVSGDMTKWEGQQRVAEYIRGATPLFEPMGDEYSAPLCEKTWEVARSMGAFGNFEDMPEELMGRDIQFTFDNPLQEAEARNKTNSFMETAELLGVASEMDPAIRRDVNIDKAFREAMLGTGAPSDWLVDEKEAQELKDQDREAAAMQQNIQGAAETAQQVGEAAQSLGIGAE